MGECADTHSGRTARCEARKAKGDCGVKKSIIEGCELTCGVCTADSLNVVSGPAFQKSAKGTTCNPQNLELQTEQECINACNELGYPYLGSWNGPGDFPKCTFTEGGNRVCHFNTSPSPGRTNPNSQYSAICLECADTHPKGTERCLKRMAKGDCVNRKAIQEKCALTCGICAADNANIVVPPQGGFQKSAKGTLCNPQTLELQTE